MTRATQESRRHHFVPRFVLRPWVVEVAPNQRKLVGYFRDENTKWLRHKARGVAGFCTQLDLLTLKTTHKLGRDALERIYFGHIDTKGAAARDILVSLSAEALSGEQRCDFARLLLSLDVRRPTNVGKLRTEVSSYFASELDRDPEIRAALDERGISETASNYVEEILQWSLEDRALIMMQKVVDNPMVGGRLISAHWFVRHLKPTDGNLVLSDRPLIRFLGFDRSNATWLLPLTPQIAFMASNNPAVIRKLVDMPPKKYVRMVNNSSARQSERYVFSVDRPKESWLKNFWPKKTA